MNNLVLYVTINYPSREKFFEILDVIEQFQVGYVEIGIPVKNPHLDGGVVRNTQELVFPTLTQEEIASVLKEVRRRYHFKVILMTYCEGIEHFQLGRLPTRLYDAILCVDKELEETDYSGLVHIFTNNLDQATVNELLASSSQFVYIVSGEGKTGEFEQLPDDYTKLLPYIKEHTQLPVFVGFGVKTPADVASILANGADGAIIGSEFIKRFNEAQLFGIVNYLRELEKVCKKSLLTKN
ncbi:tryptophan synthase subunit alpha [Enterococcus sp. 669A]|uniref:tryptophan synthase n=1 Tax=Candidatus Enterococcus moelleringii TaxID=2815325 RepID=A0ABS3L831_9ENTE|nr:tryptophan synthase subunit alpha [Enterococcus sp. 669A]MBO1305783.1 tryptophan synthase subunit alpha [Enterococcus sp. 669A]